MVQFDVSVFCGVFDFFFKKTFSEVHRTQVVGYIQSIATFTLLEMFCSPKLFSLRFKPEEKNYKKTVRNLKFSR